MAATEEASATIFYKGLSEWWSEETEYVFQRIERWAAFARGYNRLRSQRVSKGRLTMQQEPESRWNISSNKLVIENPSWSPRFHTLKRARRRSRPEEEIRINRFNQGILGYRSNGNLDSACLETYRYDHSIYFKTIGEIRNGKRNHSEEKSFQTREKGSVDGEEEEGEDEDEEEKEEGEDEDEEEEEEEEEEDKEGAEEDEEEEMEDERARSSTSDCFFNKIYSEQSNTPMSRDNSDSNESLNYFFEEMSRSSKNNVNKVVHNVWPIVDLAKLDLCSNNPREDRSSQESNNNMVTSIVSTKISFAESDSKNRNEFQINQQKNGSEMKKPFDIEKSMKYRRSSRTTKRSPVSADNNVLWPEVFLNCNKNSDPYLSVSPYHY